MVSLGMFHATVEEALELLCVVCPALPMIGLRRGHGCGTFSAQEYPAVHIGPAVPSTDIRSYTRDNKNSKELA